ncbi:hypothetical protein [Xenorhabdus sp. KK7.4]|uniref:hypothetical protein n=1 Tax=Xenorhabdus sp. KK7.4 TaxID=1851572 RepID=UPI000C05E454|nr:hypothetical protein [Xenorhabdus sp. KK7.4]PHM52806.1 Dipeptide and tripeptide permease B [Xenorhabdus sp. KK7.4]
MNDAKRVISYRNTPLLAAGMFIGFNFPSEYNDNGMIDVINNFDNLIKIYNQDKIMFYDEFKECLLNTNRENIFVDFLLQNYVCYILYFDMDEINNFLDCFSKERDLCGFLINKIFYNPIFIKKYSSNKKRIYLHMTE